jgi:hypothetical protein
LELPADNLYSRDPLTLDKRIHFVPQAKLIITIPEGNDRLVLQRFDAEEALEKSGLDYMVVTSQPPTTVHAGKSFSYQIAVRSRRKALKYRLEGGPKDMSINADGRVSWEVPASGLQRDTTVIISIRNDADQEVFHTFTLHVED